MFDKFLPVHAGNTYRGYKVAVWIFAVVVFLRVVMSVNSMFNAAEIASSADGIPLDAYPAAAAQTVVTLFAILGFYVNLMLLSLMLGGVVLSVVPRSTAAAPAS